MTCLRVLSERELFSVKVAMHPGKPEKLENKKNIFPGLIKSSEKIKMFWKNSGKLKKINMKLELNIFVMISIPPLINKITVLECIEVKICIVSHLNLDLLLFSPH